MGKKKEYNAADEAEVSETEGTLRNERDQQLEDVKSILETPCGLRFFRRIMEDGRVFQTTFTGNSNSYFLEGHRNMALKYFSDVVEAAPDKVASLLARVEK